MGVRLTPRAIDKISDIKLLGDGQLSDTIGDLYAVTSTASAIIDTITLVNTHTSSITLNLYILQSGGTDRRITQKDLTLAAGEKQDLTNKFTLDGGDKIRGDASVADKIDYTINGVEYS